MATAPTSEFQQAVAERVRQHDASDRRVYDRLTRLVSALLEAPVSLLLIADDDKLLFASFVGPDDPWSTLTEFPLSDAYCQFAIGTRAPFVVEDARKDPALCNLPPTTTLDVVSYLGVPLLTAGGDPIGILCAIDFEPRAWTERDVAAVEGLAGTVMSYLEAKPATPKAGMAGLNISAVAKRTGIGADTLRKWERRYGVLVPNRTMGGQRRYDERDVARVEWLRDRLSEGFRIGEAATLLRDDATTATSSTSGLRDAIVEAVKNPDVRHLTSLVEQAFTLHDVETVVEEIVSPALRTVGDRWREDGAAIGEEHLLTDVVRSHLRGLLADRRHPVRGTAVLACAPGERHDLGLLALAVLLQADGWLAVYLGADVPVVSSAEIANRMRAGALCLSASTPELLAEVQEWLSDAPLPDGMRVVVGGAAVESDQRLGEIVAGLRVT